MSPVVPFLPCISSTGQCTSQLTSGHSDSYHILWIKVRLLWQGDTNRLWHRLLLNISLNPALGLALAPLKEVEDLDSLRDDWWWTCARDQFISQASMWGMESLILSRKGNWQVQTSHCYQKAQQAKIQAILPTHLDTPLSRMSWILVSSSCTSKAEITQPAEPWREAIVSTRAVLVWEVSFSVSKVAWSVAPMSVWKSEILWSVLLLAGLSDIIKDVEAWKPNEDGWLKK